jgi:hypothetical protein
MSTSDFVLNPIRLQCGSFVFVLLASFPLGTLLQEIVLKISTICNTLADIVQSK